MCYMRSVAKIGVYFVSFVAVAAIAVTTSLDLHALNQRDVITYQYEWFYLDFEKRYTDWLSSPKSCPLIIGASYARQLRNVPGFDNLAITDASPSEFQHIAKLVDGRTRHLIYPITMREVALADDAPRPGILSRTVRRLLILRAAFRQANGIYGNLIRMPAPTPEELNTLRAAIGDITSVHDAYTTFEIKLFSAVDPVSIKSFRQFYEQNPKTTFILLPIYPLSDVTDSSPFAEQINKVIRQHEQLRSMMLASGLPVIDLTQSLEPHHFTDLCHFNKEGRKILHSHIRAKYSYAFSD